MYCSSAAQYLACRPHLARDGLSGPRHPRENHQTLTYDTVEAKLLFQIIAFQIIYLLPTSDLF